jgi:hypothetical protein
LVAADGTVDWWCWPDLDADPVLWRLLDPRGPALRVGPASPGPPRQGIQSVEDTTLVAHTVLGNADGDVEVTDALVWDGGTPPMRLLRLVTALRGPLDVVVEATAPAGATMSPFAEGAAAGPLVVRTGFPLDRGGRGTVRLSTGERLVVTADDGRAPPLSPDRAAATLARTATAWRRVLATADLAGPWAALVAQSLIVLRALSHRETGGLARAPTASLPEVEGGERNHDGRVVATADVAAWAALAGMTGMSDEADAAVGWLERVLHHGVPVPVVLGLDGDPPAGERQPGWAGWRHSQPVRLGADPPESGPASVAAAAALLQVAAGPWGAPLTGTWELLTAVGAWVAEAEQRSPTLAGRAALADLSEAAWRRNPLDLDAAGWHATRVATDRLFASWGPTLPGTPDPGVLAAAWLGPWPASDPVVQASVAEVRRRLGAGPWLCPDPPAASVVATLHEARALARLGRPDDAHLTLEAVATLAGPLGLLPECVDVSTGVARGNRPSAAAHLAFVEAALELGPG